MRQREAMQVARDVETRVVHPFRWAEIERVGPQNLPAPWNRRRPLGEGGDELVEARSGSPHDRYTADRQTHVRVGVLDFEEGGIERGQLLHLATFRPGALAR